MKPLAQKQETALLLKFCLSLVSVLVYGCATPTGTDNSSNEVKSKVNSQRERPVLPKNESPSIVHNNVKGEPPRAEPPRAELPRAESPRADAPTPGPASEARPTIIYFEAEPPAGLSGKSITLLWQTENTDRVQIAETATNKLWGNLQKKGELSAVLNMPTSYRLTARRGAGGTPELEVTEEIRVVVATPRIIGDPSTGPQIREFFADPPALRIGRVTKLKWHVVGAESAKISCDDRTIFSESAKIVRGNPDKEDVPLVVQRPGLPASPGDRKTDALKPLSGVKPRNEGLLAKPISPNTVRVLTPLRGEHSFKPTKTTKCQLIASKEGKVLEDALTITIIPTISRFEVLPVGKSEVKLIWETEGADSVEIDGISKPLKQKGEMIVPRSKASQYRITAGGTTKEPFDKTSKRILVPKL